MVDGCRPARSPIDSRERPSPRHSSRNRLSTSASSKLTQTERCERNRLLPLGVGDALDEGGSLAAEGGAVLVVVAFGGGGDFVLQAALLEEEEVELHRVR